MGSSLASKGMTEIFLRKGDPGCPNPVQEVLTFSYLPGEGIGSLAAGVGISVFLQP